MTALIRSELQQRIRGKRWWILLTIWFFVLLGLVALIRGGTKRALDFSPDPNLQLGAIMFGSLALLVLGLACVILPSLTATSINGERDRGTLAVLQATLLRPWQIVAAKLIAAMVTTAAFILVTLPIALWCMAEGGVGLGRAAAVYLALFAVSIVLIAAALAASALVRRPALSAVLSYGFVFALTIGTLILFGVSMTTVEPDPRTFVSDPGPRWVILSPNPFVVLADASPRAEGRRIDDPLSGIREGVRSIRDPEPPFGQDVVMCEGGQPCEVPEPPPAPPEPAPVWPTGLAIELLIAGFAFYVATVRLKVPARRLPPGERIA